MRTPCVLAKICTTTAGRRRPPTPPGLRLAGRAWRRQTPASRAGCGHRSSLPGRHQDRARGPRGPPSTRRAARENSRGRRQGRGEGAVDPPGRAGLRHVPAPLPRAPGPLTAVVRLKAAGPEHRKERSHPAQQPLTGPGARRGLGFGLGLRAKAEAEAADLAGCVLLAQKVGLHRERRHHRHSRSWSTAGQQRAEARGFCRDEGSRAPTGALGAGPQRPAGAREPPSGSPRLTAPSLPPPFLTAPNAPGTPRGQPPTPTSKIFSQPLHLETPPRSGPGCDSARQNPGGLEMPSAGGRWATEARSQEASRRSAGTAI